MVRRMCNTGMVEVARRRRKNLTGCISNYAKKRLHSRRNLSDERESPSAQEFGMTYRIG